MTWTPSGPVGVLVLVAAILGVLILVYTSGLATFLLGMIIVGLLLYTIYVLGVRIHRFLTRRRVLNRGGED